MRGLQKSLQGAEKQGEKHSAASQQQQEEMGESSEEELYVAVEETLESKGTLSVLRAQLRSAVFEAIINVEVCRVFFVDSVSVQKTC